MCARRKTTQTELADHLGISRVYMNRLCKMNRFVREERLSKMAEFFDVPLSEFIAAGE
jgi:transcriptional regulator with XRE-family HTH domain